MQRFIRILAVGAAVFAFSAVTSTLAQATTRSRVTHRVTVNPDGSFTPEVISIRAGDTVEWVLNPQRCCRARDGARG